MSESKSFVRDFPVSWAEFHRDARALAWRLVDAGPWTGIVAIARGGLIPSTIVARELDIRLIDTLCVASYDHRTQGPPRVLKAPQGEGLGWLVIDDLVDTGATARVARGLLPKAHFAAVYAKPAGRPLVDTYVTEVSQDTWIHFPWDMDMQFVRPIAEQRGT